MRFLFLIFMAISNLCQGQNKQNTLYEIKGKVVSEGQVIADAIVDLLQNSDSTLIKTEFTDETGLFTFSGMPDGEYLLKINQFSFATGIFPIMVKGANFDAGDLNLSPNVQQLQEVTIIHRKPYIERGQGKTILNVDQSINATGLSAFEILEKAPGILISSNDNISMRGKQGIMVQVDGKNLPMTGTDLANYLKGLPSSAIEKIELITNPSAKYDAAGSAIIDIRLKKDKNLGTNGSVSFSYGQGRYAKANPSITFNHRNKKINVFGNYSYAYRKFFSDLTLDRTFYNQGNFDGNYPQRNYFIYPFNNHIARIGIDVTLDKNNTFGAVFNGISNTYIMQGTNHTDVFAEPGLRSGKFNTANTADNWWYNLEGNLNYRHNFSKPGREISFDVDYAQYNNLTDQDFTTRYLNLDENPTQPDYKLNGDIKGKLNIYSIKSDFTNPINDRLQLELGFKTSLVNSDNKLVFNDLSQEVPVYDSTKSNHFLYDENINAGFISFSHTINDRWNYSLGLRAENTNIAGHQLVYDQRFDSSYTQLFPSFTMAWKPSAKHAFELALNRRIQRPGYNQLNPFKFYLDPTTYREGNPYLAPQITNSMDLTYTWNDKITSTFSYFRTNQNITEIIGPSSTEERITIQTNKNIDYAEYFSAYIIVPIQLTSWWATQQDVNLYWGQYTANLANTSINNLGNFNYNINTQQNFTITDNFSAELTGNFRASERYAFEVIDQRWSINLGLQHKLWNGKGNLRFNLQDVFFSNWTRAEVAFADYEETFLVKRESRVGTLALTYRFGKTGIPGSRRRAGGADDLKGRANQAT